VNEPLPGERPFKRLSPLTPLVRGFLVLVAVVGTSWDDLLRGDLGPLAWALLIFLLAGAVYGFASWLRTKYWIEDDELRVDTGVISRQSRRIRVDRLQGIDVVQPFVARLFGLAELRMDVAGGGAREGSLAFLPLSDAHVLRDVLLARRDAVRARRDSAAAGPPEDGVEAPPGAFLVAQPERVLARLDAGRLVVSLLLSGETIGFLVSSAAFVTVLLAVGGLGGAAGLVPVLIGFGVALFRKLSAFYDFTVSDTQAGLQVRRGLLERTTQTITLARVQGVVITEPLLWRPLGWARLDVSLAGYGGGGDNGPSSSTVMPVALMGETHWLARMLLQGKSLESVPLHPAPERARWAAPVRWKGLAVGADDELVVSKAGVLTRRTHAAAHARVQSLRLHQGPWQRRLGLADLLVDSPPGAVHVRARHRYAGEARLLLQRLSELTRAARRHDGAGNVRLRDGGGGADGADGLDRPDGPDGVHDRP
jgi:putative membrane protein